jgi:putative ABC transport system permease protein
MKTIKSVLSSFARSPLKLTLTLLTVGVGVGVLIFALSISGSFSRFLKAQLEQDGIVVMVSNATISEETGAMEPVRPSGFDAQVLDVLRSDVPGVAAVSPVDSRGFNELAANGATWRIRSMLEVDQGYVDVMNLDIVAGSAFTAEDVTAGAKKALISQSLATLVFGSVDAAIGQTMKSPAPTSTSTTASGGQASGASSAASSGAAAPTQRGPVMPSFTVCGVFADVGELARTAYGVGDMLVPYTSSLAQGANAQMARVSALSTIAVRVNGVGLASVQAEIRAALAAQYGEDVAVQVWEGTPRGETGTLEEARATVSAFSLVVNLLGFILLATGSIGILSIMLVEVLGRGREIAIERALGASGGVVAREYFARSLLLSFMSAILGVALSLAFAGPLRELVLPIFNGVSAADLGGRVITPAAVAVGVASALLVGGVFGVFPVIPALRANIAESMREA